VSRCTNFDTKRQFLLDYVEKVVILKDKVSLHGAVPIKGGEDVETSALPFCTESEITSEERRREKLRTTQAYTAIVLCEMVPRRYPSGHQVRRFLFLKEENLFFNSAA
jgi:hypothetical protein